MITRFDQLDLSKRYTYADYLQWQFDERVELFKGWVKKMSPAPNRRHQDISMKMTLLIGNYLQEQNCRLYTAPFDVRLPVSLKKNRPDTVVQPDLCVICDLSKLDQQGCNGAPDLIVEILSPGNSKREMRDKYQLYEEAGVREYWIVDPERETILVYRMADAGAFVGDRPYTAPGVLSSSVLPAFSVAVEELFVEN